MKKIAIFLIIMTICGGALDATADSQNDKYTAPAVSTYVHTQRVAPTPLKPIKPLYTIDNRKYVSRDEAPFSAVVGLKYRGGKNWCSGALTADGIVTTAKHCIFDETSNTYEALSDIIINSKDGNTGVKHGISSGGDIYPNDNYDNTYDWALLVPEKDIKSDVKANKLTQGTNNVVVAGYGGLKILSDQEIRNIRTEYAKWLNHGVGTNLASSSGVDLNSRRLFGKQFVSAVINDKIAGIPADTFEDTHRLKASYCLASLDNTGGNEKGCQVWGGNSGGPVFYKYNNQWYLYGIQVSGKADITNNRNTYARGGHMVPINLFIKHYQQLVSKLKEAKK